MKKSSGLTTIAITFITAAGFGLRLTYLLNSHPFIDEFTTALAAQMILQKGLPILPSGLFYEHGMFFTYVAAPFVAFANQNNLITLARIPSLLIGTATIPLTYRIGKRWFAPWVGLIAAAFLAFSPEGMVWGGRARMYALAQLLILLTAFLAFEGSRGAGEQGRGGDKEKARLRWLALLTFLAALLTQFGTLMFVPPMVVGIIFLRWQAPRNTQHAPRFTFHVSRTWLWQTIALGAIIGVGMLVKRLGQPLGMAQLGEESIANPISELWKTVAYQIGVTLDWGSTVKFLSRQFGVPHHFWLTVIALLGLSVFVALLLANRASSTRKSSLVAYRSSLAYIFLWLVFGLVIVEMIVFLEPFRRNPRYIVMGLPLFYLIAAGSLRYLLLLIKGWFALIKDETGEQNWQRHTLKQATMVFFAVLLILYLPGLWKDLAIVYRTPEPPYDQAFQYVADHQRPGDAVLTMNTSAAALYLDQVDYFAIQHNAEQFLINRSAADPVDRWLGAPWIGTAADFNRVLNENDRAWFVVDTQRLTTFGFYLGDWLAILDTQMEQVWAEDGALVYRTRLDRAPIPTEPEVAINAQLGDAVRLDGYALDVKQSSHRLTIFWTALSPIESDYTIFIHLRDEANNTVAQWDRRPLGGAYLTSQWQPGETVIDPHRLDLPPGKYHLAIGMYRLDTLERLPVLGDVSGENAVILPKIIGP